MKPKAEEPQTWSPDRRSALVLRILRWDEPLEDVARKAGVSASEAKYWTEVFVSAGEQALMPRTAELERGPERIRALERKLGEMALEMDRLRKRASETIGSTDD